MRQIPGYSLWLGHVGDGRNIRAIHEQGIQAVVDLAADEKPPMLTRDLASYRFPLLDGAGNPPWLLQAAVDTVAHLIRHGVPTLVFCGAGMSRTPSIVACAMARVTGVPAKECLESLLENRPSDVAIGLWNELMLLNEGAVHGL